MEEGRKRRTDSGSERIGGKVALVRGKREGSNPNIPQRCSQLLIVYSLRRFPNDWPGLRDSEKRTEEYALPGRKD